MKTTNTIGDQIHRLQDFLFVPCIYIDYTINVLTNNCRSYEINKNKYKILREYRKLDNIIGDMITIETCIQVGMMLIAFSL